MHKQTVVQWIRDLRTAFDEEQFYRKQALAFLEEHDDFWQRTTLEGQFTGSAWVLNPARDKVLLIHHRGLDKWFQPGGHAEMTDESLLETARREASEECGLQGLTLLSEDVFDLDIHVIPSKGDVPEHLHFDVRFMFVSDTETLDADLAEVKDLQWESLEGLLRALDTQQSLRRMAIKTLLLLSS